MITRLDARNEKEYNGTDIMSGKPCHVTLETMAAKIIDARRYGYSASWKKDSWPEQSLADAEMELMFACQRVSDLNQVIDLLKQIEPRRYDDQGK